MEDDDVRDEFTLVIVITTQNQFVVELAGDQTANFDGKWYNSLVSPSGGAAPTIQVVNGNRTTSALNWEEITVAADADPSIVITNNDANDPLTLNGVDYFISLEPVDLALLNTEYYPEGDPLWAEVPGIPIGITLNPGQGVQSLPVPEPATLSLMALSMPVLLGRRRRVSGKIERHTQKKS